MLGTITGAYRTLRLLGLGEALQWTFHCQCISYAIVIHHLSNGIIVAANVIDRAVYLLFLGLLFVLVFTMHAGQKLGWKQVTREAEAVEAEQASHDKS